MFIEIGTRAVPTPAKDLVKRFAAEDRLLTFCLQSESSALYGVAHKSVSRALDPFDRIEYR